MAFLAWKVALKGLLYCIVFRFYLVLQVIKNPENYDLYGGKQVLKIIYIHTVSFGVYEQVGYKLHNVTS